MFLAPNCFFGKSPPPEILDRHYKTQLTTDHRAKFDRNRPTELGDLALKEKKKKSVVRHKSAPKTNVFGWTRNAFAVTHPPKTPLGELTVFTQAPSLVGTGLAAPRQELDSSSWPLDLTFDPSGFKVLTLNSIFGNASVSPWLTAFTSDEGEKSGQKDENERKKKRKKCVRRGGKEEREKRSRRHKKKSVPHLWEDGCTPAATWNALQRQIVWKVMWNYYADIIMTIQHVAKSVS